MFDSLYMHDGCRKVIQAARVFNDCQCRSITHNMAIYVPLTLVPDSGIVSTLQEE